MLMTICRRAGTNKADKPSEVSNRVGYSIADKVAEKVHHNLKTKNLKI
jgi:hypothetical protein